jgi:hypothetical protein
MHSAPPLRHPFPSPSSGAAYISTCSAEIRKELKSPDGPIKAQAVSKLVYLQMLGYEMSFAAFDVVQVMALPLFSQKRIGFLAASQSFTTDTPVALLCCNLLKKMLGGNNQYLVRRISGSSGIHAYFLLLRSRPPARSTRPAPGPRTPRSAGPWGSWPTLRRRTWRATCLTT